MAYQRRIESLTIKLSLSIGLIVALLSIVKQISFLHTVIRSAGAFLIIYFISSLSLALWYKVTPQKPYKKDSRNLDIVIGDSFGEEQDEIRETPESKQQEKAATPGQITINSENEQIDARKQAEMAAKMGWEEKEQ